MTLAILLVIIAVLSLAVVFRLGIARALEIPGKNHEIEPLDVEAFRNLIDPAEEQYLRGRLQAGEFRRVQRTRLRAAALYIRAASRNAAILVRVAEAGLASPDPHSAQAARQLLEDALLLRRNAVFALLRIYTALGWPTAVPVAGAPVLDGYRRLDQAAMLLGRLQNPAATVRVSTL
jgi:hypothetical protein